MLGMQTLPPVTTTLRRRAVSTAFLLLLTALAACADATAERAPDTAGAADDSAGLVAIRVAPVQTAEDALEVVATGVLAARDEAPLGFAVGGVVREVRVREGDRVRRGDVLATLDARDVDARLAQARSAAAKAERDLERLRALHEAGAIPLAQLQDAITAAELARAEVASAEYARRYATIVAPANGVVLRRLAEPGQVLAPGAPVLVVGERDAGTVLRVGVPDRDVVRLQLGDRATVTFEAQPGRTYAGVVEEIAAAATERVGTYAVELRLTGADALPTGLVGRARIAARAAGAVQLVPTSALVEADGEEATVYVPVPDDSAAVRPGDVVRVQRRSVSIARLRDDGTVVVTGGLDGAVAVVTDGASFVRDGARARVVP